MLYKKIEVRVIAFFVWVKYKNGQPQGLAPIIDVFHATVWAYRIWNNHLLLVFFTPFLVQKTFMIGNGSQMDIILIRFIHQHFFYSLALKSDGLNV